MGITEDQVKIADISMIQTTRALNVEEEKIGDVGKTADPLEIVYDPADIFRLRLISENLRGQA